MIQTDFDMDGLPEYLYQGRNLNAYVHLMGGSLIELDYLPAGWNYLDTMARWPEPYHKRKYDGCDWYPRKGFIDHFFMPGTDIERFDRMTKFELGSFVNQLYELVDFKRDHKGLTLQRTGAIRQRGGQVPVSVRKKYRFKDSAIHLLLSITNLGVRRLDLWYAAELNLSMTANNEASLRIIVLNGGQKKRLGNDRVETANVDTVQIQDLVNKVSINLEAAENFALWTLPVQTLIPDDADPEQPQRYEYQSTCIVPQWKFSLDPQATWECELALGLQRSS
jgi:hypothetical protein